MLKIGFVLDWGDIGYNFLIGGDGRVYTGRGWTRVGAHSGALLNPQSLGIAFMGIFQTNPPSQIMTDAFHKLIQNGIQQVV